MDDAEGKAEVLGEDAVVAALAARCPEFRVRRMPTGHRGMRYVAERRNGLEPGLHTMITANLDELREALRRG